MRRGAGRLGAMFGLLVCGTAGCGHGSGALSVDAVQNDSHFNSDDRLGKSVSVAGTVVDRRGPTAVYLSPDADPRGRHLLVLTDSPFGAPTGVRVRATGTLGQLHSAPSGAVSPYEQEDFYSRPGTEAYLYHAAVSILRSAH